MDESVENCLSLSGVEKLIQVPSGCAEQTMVKMAPAVYAIEYLDASNQWVNFNPERKQEAIGMIETGRQERTKQDKPTRNQSIGSLLPVHTAHWLQLPPEDVPTVLTQPQRNAPSSGQEGIRDRTCDEGLGG